VAGCVDIIFHRGAIMDKVIFGVLVLIVLSMSLWQFMDIITGATTIHANKENRFTTKVPYEDVWKTYSCVRVQSIKK